MAPEPTIAKVRLHERRCAAADLSWSVRPLDVEVWHGAPWLALVDLGQLTERQREALRAARETGYFRPGGGDVAQLAAAMHCSRSTAHEHLQKAMLRLVEGIQGT